MIINPKERKRIRRIQQEEAERARYTAFITGLTEALRHTQIGLSTNMHVTYAQRPPHPRPEQITVTYVMQDGQEYRTFIPLNGQVEWTENPPHWVMQNAQMISQIRYSIRYRDGGV